ncbi:MAG: ribosome maturation factor RimP [Cyclobacteriaceae bacterium]|jgi:ribosome maturation factor RimP|nr:ribosome maturation factor RimP [Cyclobacteriaceae bacterium]
MELTERIRQLAEQQLKDASQFVVDVVASLRKSPNKIVVIIDGDHGVTIDDCADISLGLSQAMDKEDVLPDRYMLEVSTPGLDHPLKLKRQYYKNVGRKVRVKAGAEIQEGLLKSVTEESILLEQESGKGKKKEVKEVTIPFTDIEKTFVLVSFK